jgi:hypothetical protein
LLADGFDFFLIEARPFVGVLAMFLFGHPSACGHVGGRGWFGAAGLGAFLLVQVFAEGPVGLEFACGAAVFLGGGEAAAVELGGFADGLFGLLFGCGEPAFALEAEAEEIGGGIGSAEEGAGTAFGHVAVEEALHALGNDEQDGGLVFEEGYGVVSFDAGELGFAKPAVAPAVMIAGHGDAAALLAAGFNEAAALFLVSQRIGGVGSWFVHGFLSRSYEAVGCDLKNGGVRLQPNPTGDGRKYVGNGKAPELAGAFLVYLPYKFRISG